MRVLCSVPHCDMNEEFYPGGANETNCLQETVTRMVPGCFCKPGYYRSGTVCVLIQDCGCIESMSGRTTYRQVETLNIVEHRDCQIKNK